ncbi:hypothetical protein IQ274_19515 [Nostoc sp. LEGE 12447]|uniref:hypothetical protein n=1 Tax=Nostoc sp. LEGE 12447 TaxID=1828640 RepID=UPI0018844EBA|nr:hypothetical protein [Nostoc sp. LEGE 12447]MBE9000368.1 hypothetical protein [Nostoc sp. LEGE 12447]
MVRQRYKAAHVLDTTSVPWKYSKKNGLKFPPTGLASLVPLGDSKGSLLKILLEQGCP